MRKFFSLNEAKEAFLYSKSLASEVHEELVGCKIRLASNAIRSVLESQANSFWDRDRFAVDDGSDEDSEDQE